MFNFNLNNAKNNMQWIDIKSLEQKIFFSYIGYVLISSTCIWTITDLSKNRIAGSINNGYFNWSRIYDFTPSVFREPIPDWVVIVRVDNFTPDPYKKVNK